MSHHNFGGEDGGAGDKVNDGGVTMMMEASKEVASVVVGREYCNSRSTSGRARDDVMSSLERTAESGEGWWGMRVHATR